MAAPSAVAPLPAYPFRRPAPCGPFAAVWPFAPGSAVPAAAEAAGLAWLAEQGLAPRAAPRPPNHFHYAGTDDERLRALLAGLAGPADVFWARRGGSGTARLLAALEAPLAARLAARPPWLCGFSDVTALHARFAAHRVMSLHAANVTTLPTWSASARAELMALLGPAPPMCVYEGRPGPWAHAPVTGPLVGGNLTVLASLVGTGVLPSWQGCIVLLEDVGEAPYRLDRALFQLIMAGQLAGVAGVALGQLTDCDGPRAAEQASERSLCWLLATLAPLCVPIVSGLPLGHAADSRAVLLGARATLEAACGRLTVVP